MRCDRFRDAVSARLDDEPIGMSSAVLDDHLASCPDCARWSETAARVTRLTRLDVTPVPDLADTVLSSAALPAGRVLRKRRILRVALFAAAVAQLVVGIPALAGDSMAMAMSVHAAHENAAWNIAIGVAFLATAMVPRRAAGLIPLVGTFTLVLAVLSVRDLASGAVTLDRLATHLAVVFGLAMLIALDRVERALPPSRGWTRRYRADVDDDERPNLRGVA